MPCTTLLVGKKASYDGSTIVARNEDSGGLEFNPKRMCVVRPSDQPVHYRAQISHLELDLPEGPMRYTALPDAIEGRGIWAEAGVNEANVSMSATETLTTNERVLGADPYVELVAHDGLPEVAGGIGEEDMVTLVLPYVRSARDGVRRLGGLLERYGTYEPNGIAFSDVDEIWWLETVGGHHWIARRVPDDAYVTMPNQLGIDSFDLDDAEGEQRDFMASPDLRTFVADNHLDLTLDGPFNPRDAFGSHSDADHVYNTPRAWAMQRFLSPHAAAWDEQGPSRGPEADDISWSRVPERRLTIEDVKYALSLHYQGTPYDPYGHHGDDARRGKYRPIGINRNGQLSVVQIRPYGPEYCRSVQWVAFGCNVFNALVPLHANVDSVPEYLSDTSSQVTTDSLYWANRIIAALADAHFHECAAHVERYQLKVGSLGHANVAAADARCRDLSYAQATGILADSNQAMAALLREQTDELLGHVLYEASCGMRNAFSRSDA
jgi:dipeptidase